MAPAPEIPSQFSTDAGMIALQASSDFSETEMLFPPPIDEGPFLQIEMPVPLSPAPPPVYLG